MRLARIEHADVRRGVRARSRPAARLGVAQHEDVDRHRLQRVDRVEHRLAFHARRGLHLEVDDVGAQTPAASSKETRVRVLGSKKRLATVRPARLVVARRRLAGRTHIGSREVEQTQDLLARQAVEREQVPQSPCGVALLLAAACRWSRRAPAWSVRCLQPGLEDQPRRVRIDVLAPHSAPARTRASRIAQVRLCGERGQALVHEVHRQLVPLAQLCRELAAVGGQDGLGTVHIIGQPDHAAGVGTIRAGCARRPRPSPRRRAPAARRRVWRCGCRYCRRRRRCGGRRNRRRG